MTGRGLCDLYIRKAKLIGVLYCVVPAVAWAGFMLTQVEFRTVYLLRLGLVFVIGGAVAAMVNDFGVRIWLIKHRSKEGPATVMDGLLVGAGVGAGIVLLPPLTSFIATNHPEEAKAFVIMVWLVGVFVGAVVGSVLAAIGRKHLEGAPPVADGNAS
jgi:hypothetical protein